MASVHLFLTFFSAVCACQAAASGQRDLRFEKEDHAPGDSAREDVRCLIKEVSSVPQEFKREFACTSGTDTEGGIGRNRAGFAKVKQ
jgi:hypothetical protein